MAKIKYIPDKKILQVLNNRATSSGYNQTLVPEKLATLPDAKYPITQRFLHNDDTVRCRIVLNDQGDTAYLDIGIDVYNALPEIETGCNHEYLAKTTTNGD